MAGEVAVDDVGGVGVGVEMDDADVAVPVHVGDRRRGRPRDRVVAAEDDRHDAAPGDLVDPGLDVGVADFGLAVRAVGVAEVDDLEVVEDLDPEIHVIGPGLVGGGPDGAGAEPGAGPVGGRDVERGADDRHVGLPRVELLGVGQERPLPERRQPTEHVAEIQLLAHPRRQLARRLAVAAMVVPVMMTVPHERST